MIARDLLKYLLETECTDRIIDNLRKEDYERNISESSEVMNMNN